MTPEEQRDYAATLILEHARDVEYVTVHEMSEEHLGFEIDDNDARIVDELISKATITISWPNSEQEWTNQDGDGEDG
jgi:hypothetical protein